MNIKMLMNAVHPEECRVAIVEGGVLQELEVEYSGREQTRGNIYKGIVTKVEPSIHALFVDYGRGSKKQGFLPFGEVHPANYGLDKNKEGSQARERPTIEKQIRPGQEILVQVVKEERDTKGAYLTTYISIAGRYLVLMPGSRKGGVSRKIEDENEREKLRDIVSTLDIPEDMGVIIRTAGTGRTKGDLKRDLGSLLRIWNNIKKGEKTCKPPSLIYREGDIVIRSIRDYFSTDVDEIIVDNPDAYKKAREFIKIIMPRYQSKVRLYQEAVPLFSRHNLEEQIELIFSNSVPLKSGGSIVIDPTEALVSIDVNSGRSRGEKGIEDTAFRTNMEAAGEIARELRLRDLGGLIVIDFIDMRQKKHIIEVEKTLKNALKRDKARIDVGRVSKFGLLEMSRQRIRSSIIERSFVECHYCGGSGTIRTLETNTVHMLRKIHESVMNRDVKKVEVILPAETAEYLLNNKKEEILKIEKDYGAVVLIKGQPGLPVNSYNIEVSKRAAAERPSKPPLPREGEAEGEASPAKKPKGKRGGYSGGRRKKRPELQKQEDKGPEPEGESNTPKGLLTRIKSVITGE